MADFISQGSIDAGLTPDEDALGHEPLARAIIAKAAYLRPGTVMAIQGSWGHGKTDVLCRIVAIARDAEKHGLRKGLIADALWVNPWQYGTPDLLTPLVLSLLHRLPPEKKKNDKRLRCIVETLLRAGLNFGIKAISTAAGAPILGLAADAVDRIVGGLFSAAGIHAEADVPDPDPVASMAERFKELVDHVLAEKGTQQDARLLICVDDLDRCLPDRQVALLEAIRFLISSGAAATFLIALDPTLARQAILTHYGTREFDPDRYIDKMFDLRVNLPALGVKVSALVQHHLNRSQNTLGAVVKVGEGLKFIFGDNTEKLPEAALEAFEAPDLANPRVIRRIFDRLYLLSAIRIGSEQSSLFLDDKKGPRAALAWMGIVERWPQVRRAIQSVNPDEMVEVLENYLRGASGKIQSDKEKEAYETYTSFAALHGLQDAKSDPSLTATLKVILNSDPDLATRLDLALIEAGL